MRTFTQDMPPKEGYRPYQIERVPLRIVVGGRKALLACLVVTVAGHYFINYKDWKKTYINMTHMCCTNYALAPILIAEKDRALLKQVKRNVAEEKELMRYLPKWKVGTYFGEPIYKSIPEDTFIEPTAHELYAHAHEDSYVTRIWIRQSN